MRRLWWVLVVLAATPAFAKPPKLTLFISVDSLGADVVLRNRPLWKGGLGTAISQGAFFPNVRYEYAEPVTAAGHATLVTGANPWRHGIIGNAVVNRANGKFESIFTDPDHPVLEAPPSTDDTSPARLLAETLADRLVLETRGRGKAVAVSAKPRAAIAMAGKLGTAWWFSDQVGKFVTGTWYAKEFPAWVKAFNEKKPADASFGKQWALSLPAKSYPGEDDRPWESDWYGLGRTFPHVVNGGATTPGPEFYKALGFTPFMNDLLVQMAKAALDGEQLGKNDDPDALFVGFSPIDRIYHLYGPYSWEMQDALVKLDKNVGELIAAAEKAAGKGNVLVVISADHGGAALAEEWTAAGLSAARVDLTALTSGLNKALKQQFGLEPVLGIEETDVYLDEKALAAKKVDGLKVRDAAAEWLRGQPDILLAVTRDQLFSAADPGGWLRSLQLNYYPGRSGDVFLLMRPFHVLTDEKTGTNHGTPYTYDNTVPLVLFGKGVRAGSYPAQISAVDVAPTVTALWETIPPASCEGTARAEALAR